MIHVIILVFQVMLFSSCSNNQNIVSYEEGQIYPKTTSKETVKETQIYCFETNTVITNTNQTETIADLQNDCVVTDFNETKQNDNITSQNDCIITPLSLETDGKITVVVSPTVVNSNNIPNHIEVKVYNNTDTIVLISQDPSVQYFSDNEWHHVCSSISPDVLTDIPPKEYIEFKYIPLADSGYIFQTGVYRVYFSEGYIGYFEIIN